MAGRTYRRDAKGRFAGNGNTSGGTRRALQQQAGSRGTRGENPRRIYSGLHNQRSKRNTIAQSPMQRQRDQFKREMAATPLRNGKRRTLLPNSYSKGRRPGRITESEFAMRPQRVGTVSRRSSTRAGQKDLRSELKGEKRTMASFRRDYQRQRRYVRA